MFKTIYTFELARLFRQAATYAYFAVFFVIALFSMLGAGGFFDEVPDTPKAARWLNSAYEINFMFHYFGKFLLFLLPAIIGMVIYKDFRNKVYPILYAYPISKPNYLLGKFFSGLTAVLFVTFSIGMAFGLGEWMLGKTHPQIGPTNFAGYAISYLFFIIPNMLAYGLLVFAVVAALRNIFSGFTVVILLFFVQIIVENCFDGNVFLIALFDPFGQNAAAYETRYWTIAEQNNQQMPVFGVVLWNRILWATISLAGFGIFYKKFQLEQEPFRLFHKQFGKRNVVEKTGHNLLLKTNHRTDVRLDFSLGQQLIAMGKLSAYNFRFIVKNWLFYLLVLFALLALVFALERMTIRGDMTYLPLTRIMLAVPMFFFSTVIILQTFIYSGMLVHRSRMASMHQLEDATATASWVLMGSKVLALVQVQLLLLFTMMACGIGLQVYHHYYHFELGLYFFHLFVLTFPILAIWAAVSIFVHTLLPNLYLGLFTLLLAWLGKDQLPRLGIESHLLLFNTPPPLTYSDMNGFGNGLMAHHLVNAYWLVFAGCLLILAFLFWQRGFTDSVRERLEIAVQRFRGIIAYIALAGFLLLLFLGFLISQEENSPFKATVNDDHRLKKFRAEFEKYQSIAQPKIVAVKLNLELFPESHFFSAKGDYLIVNNTMYPIDTLLVRTGYDEITDYYFNTPSRIAQEAVDLNFAVLVLEKPILPNDSLRMHFEIRNKPNTVFCQNSAVLKNGSFLRSDILPRFGLWGDHALREPSDSLAKKLNFYTKDADLVEMETLISTSHRQTAIAPGYLQNQWTKGDRNYFHYRTKEHVKFAFAFNTGVFSVYKSEHQGIGLEIYHHPSHKTNLKDMVAGLKAALDYNTAYFGPFQHREVKIIAFPLTEGSYASVMGNSIPTSEVRFVLRNTALGNRVNLPFYVQAHELTHQWWGNQVVPADALGAKMLTESITEYISLRIYDKYFGPEKARNFLSLQRQRYLEGRTGETNQESPLYLVRPDQEYIAYGKGAMAFHTLQHYVGEEKLNSILRSFLEQYKFRTDQYPSTIDLIAHLKKSLPGKFHYIITDMMESILFYANKINAVLKLPKNQLAITFTLSKFDQTLKQELSAQDVFIEIGQYDQEGRLLGIHQCRVSSGENKITVPQMPKAKKIVLDPHLHFIELDLEDNSQILQ